MGTGKEASLFTIGLLVAVVVKVCEGYGQPVVPAFRVPECSGEYSDSGRDVRSADEQPIDMAEEMEAQMEECTVTTPSPPRVLLQSLNVTFVGKVMITPKNRTMDVYQGIKYGFADRFKHSVVSGQYWGSEAEVTVDRVGAKCPQVSPLEHYAGSEDCLFLDIYIPKVQSPINSTAELLPVMFYIHGGSFTSGETSYYLPAWIMDQDVIVVVIQYRLGALGWLSLQNDDIPGNAGLSDQITALKWVKQNIDDFGGDPEKVTLFGQSAGATSVTLLQTIGPITQGLFSGVIGQSGSALEHWAIDTKPVESATTFANEFCNCQNATNSTNIYDCLTALPVEVIAMCTHDMVSSSRLNGLLGNEGCAPVVQGTNVSESNRLVTKMPREYIIAGEAVDVPIMMGANRDEGSFAYAMIFQDYLWPKNLYNDSSYFANNSIQDSMTAFNVQASLETIKVKYFPGINMTSLEAVAPGMIDFLGVYFVKAGTYQTAMLHSTHYNSSTYFYSFDYATRSNTFDFIFSYFPVRVPFKPGVTHAEELMYFFIFPYTLPFTAHQWLNSARLVTLWTNFAKYGNPTPTEEINFRALGLPQWPELTPEESNYLLMEEHFHVAVNYTDRWTFNVDMLKRLEAAAAASNETLTPAAGSSVSESDVSQSLNETGSTMAYDMEVASSDLDTSEPTVVNPTIARMEYSSSETAAFTTGISSTLDAVEVSAKVSVTDSSHSAMETAVDAVMETVAQGIETEDPNTESTTTTATFLGLW